MKALAAGIGVVCLSPLLLAGTALSVATAAQATTQVGQCLPDLDTAQLSQHVANLIDDSNPSDVTVEGLDLPEQQLPHARTIVATGISLDIPRRGQVVALATAMQESRLRNLAYGDRDSLGLFQQRPSQGWGTPAQIRDPVHASKRFYQALLKVSGWQHLTVAQAAQAVQRSAYPDAYAQWEPLATALQQALAKNLPGPGPESGTRPGTGPSGCTSEDGAQFGPIPEGEIPASYAIPESADPRAAKAITWAMRQLGTMYQWGGSCTAPHGPDPMGRCDCSSLTQQAYAHAAIELTRTTYTQVNEGKAVPANRLRPGDLIFSRGSAARPEHVGMYLGEGLVIEAPGTGDLVQVNPLAEWTVLAARRVP